MESNKTRVILDYMKLSRELKDRVRLACSTGYGDFLVYYKNGQGQKAIAFRLETEEKVYLLRMSSDMASKLLENHPEFTDDNCYSSCGVELSNDKFETDAEYLFDKYHLRETEEYLS